MMLSTDLSVGTPFQRVWGIGHPPNAHVLAIFGMLVHSTECSLAMVNIILLFRLKQSPEEAHGRSI